MPNTVEELCQKQGWTAADLALRTKLEESRVQAILMRRWTPSPSERQRIATVFNMPSDEIVWGHATPIQHLYGHGPG